MSLKGFYASYLAVERVERGENVDTNKQELVTPFPGSLKTIYSNRLSNSDDTEEEQINGAVIKPFEAYSAFQQSSKKIKE